VDLLKRELAIELRRLQFANRPVSSTETKTRLEEFFVNTINANDSTNHRRNNPDVFRSDNMRNEIEVLGSQRRVSSILQSARQRLEATLQRFATPSPPTRPAPTQVQSTVEQPTLNQSATYTNGLQTSSTSINSLQSNTSNNLIVQSSDGTTNLLTPVTAYVPVIANNSLNGPVLLNHGPWLTAQRDPIRTSIDELRREQIIEEISELVHQQLVSSTLESQFRRHLEQQIMSQLQMRGDDGQRTRDFIQRLTQTERIERNDFSHLGIQRQSEVEIGDSASVLLDQATALRFTQPSSSREMRNVQMELKELKTLMKLSFELQLDMQRSLRQEIAALIAGTLTQQQSVPRASSLNTHRASNEGSCVICTEGQVDTVFYKCGHMSVS
jgi:hypothetical protein